MREPGLFQYQIANLLRGASDDSPEITLRYIAEYFEFLAEALRPNTLADAVEQYSTLFESFEAVSLWLQGSLGSGEVAKALTVTLRKHDLGRLFAILADASPDELRRSIRLSHPLGDVFGFLFRSKWDPLLSPKELFEARLALRRAAQTVKYLATLEDTTEDDDIAPLREHYDPELIDRNRILALVHLLRSQLAELPADSSALRVLTQVDSIQRELQRPRVRWKRVIASAFIVLAVLADVKTVAPDLYGKAFNTASALVDILRTPLPDLPRLPEPSTNHPSSDDIVLPPPSPREERDA